MDERTEEYIRKLIEVFTARLDELKDSQVNKQYAIGEMTAYVTSLQIIQRNDKSNLYNLDYDIEKKYLSDESTETRHEK